MALVSCTICCWLRKCLQWYQCSELNNLIHLANANFEQFRDKHHSFLNQRGQILNIWQRGGILYMCYAVRVVSIVRNSSMGQSFFWNFTLIIAVRFIHRTYVPLNVGKWMYLVVITTHDFKNGQIDSSVSFWRLPVRKATNPTLRGRIFDGESWNGPHSR